VLSQTYLRLASFARNEGASVLEIMQAKDLNSLFFLPLSEQAFEELETLQAQLQDIPFDDNATDSWVPVWGNTYTSRKFYSQVFKNMEAHSAFQIIWKSRCTPRVKFFVWLVLVDRLNTKVMLQRRHLDVQDDVICVMCNSWEEETIDHLFFNCDFAKECWASIKIEWDMSLPLLDRYTQARHTHAIPFFTEATLIAAWELWKVRNDKIFRRRDPSPSIWFSNFKYQCNLQSVCFKDVLRSSFCVWLDAFS
jgi:hypothetical protein